MDPDLIEIAVGDSKKITVKDAQGVAVTTGITWASSNTAVATVSNVGEVRGVAAGLSTISAKGATSSGEMKVSVKAPPTT